MPTSRVTAPPKKHALTFAQLSTYDDILTDALVDHVYYWTTIPKNRPSYHASRCVREEEICEIIQDEIVLNKDIEAAEEKLLHTNGLQRVLEGLKTVKQKEDFRKHLRRYAQIYMPDCPWEVNSTNRYTITSHEAAITARRDIRRNESIKYLSGIQVVITPEEEKEISVRKKDFSIVVSSRNKCTSLFMGPARFANHDCDANAKLMTTGQAGIEIIATKPIQAGDEITVTYGESYFGEDNCECLCYTCEQGCRNGWAPETGAIPTPKAAIDLVEDSYALRRRPRDDSVGGSRTPSVTPDMRPRISKSRSKSSLLRRDSSSLSALDPEATPRGRKRQLDKMASPPITPVKKSRHFLEAPASTDRPSSRASSFSGSMSVTSREPCETDATTPEETPDPLRTPAKAQTTPIVAAGILPVQDPAHPVSPPNSQAAQSPDEGTEDLVTIEATSIPEIINSTVNIVAKEVAPIAVSIESVEPSQQSSDSVEASEEATPNTSSKSSRRAILKRSSPPTRQRMPGDYVLTPLLLSEPETAWIQCTICPTYFVQRDAYFTRASCPRCERHSKLYGYVWPKADKDGPQDKEKRVLDHRLIHRFLDPDGERKIRGRKSMKKEEEDEEMSDEDTRGRHLSRKGSRVGVSKKSSTSKMVQGRGISKSKPESMTAEEEDSSLRRSGRMCRVSNRLEKV